MSERPISRGRSLAPARVWLDDPNPLFRRGMACCLAEHGYLVVGESCGLIPAPGSGVADLAVFDLGDPVTSWGLATAGAPTPRMLGVAVAAPCGRLSMAELVSVVVRRGLRPETLLDVLGLALSASDGTRRAV